MNQGWIKLHRQILDCDIWIDDEEPFDRRSAWIDLLLLVNHRDKQIIFDGHPLTVKRGTYVTSVRKLAKRWSWCNKKTLNYLRLLEELGMIVKDSDNRRTLITIVNYEVYQEVGNANETVRDTQRERSMPTNKNVKNVKNEKNNIRDVFFANNGILNNEFGQYVLMRKKLKKPFTTDHAVELAINKLMKLANGNEETAIKILQQSISNSWQGLFELKQEKKQPQYKQFSHAEREEDLERELLS